MRKKVIVDLISIMLIILFVYTAVSKLLDYESFLVELSKSPILTVYSGFVSWLIPSAEIIVSLMLMFVSKRFIALYASFTLMVMFTTYIVVILNLSSYVPCTCGGVIQNMNWNQHLIFNLIFTALSAIAILLHPKRAEVN